MCRFKLKLESGLKLGGLCFNTSYVSVQGSPRRRSSDLKRFQYILCVGSREQSFKDLPFEVCFNTSYVSVQVFLFSFVLFLLLCFNTSYVSVQAFAVFAYFLFFLVSIHPMCRFKPSPAHKELIASMFQYILCVGSSDCEDTLCKVEYLFQYILCVGSSYEARV